VGHPVYEQLMRVAYIWMLYTVTFKTIQQLSCFVGHPVYEQLRRVAYIWMLLCTVYMLHTKILSNALEADVLDWCKYTQLYINNYCIQLIH